MSGFPTWAPNGVGVTYLHILFELLLCPLSVLLWCLSLCSWVTLNLHRCLRKGLVWWALTSFVCQMSPFNVWCHYFADISSRYDVAKGSISFGAAHLRFCSAWFVTLLPPLLSLVKTKLLYIHLNLFATENELKWNDPSNRNIIYFLRLLFKMSGHEITKITKVAQGPLTTSSLANKKIVASRKRIFRVAIMSGACLLMNTAATASVSVVLREWSVSSDQWLTCTITETFYTRNWANYGLHAGVRYFLYVSWRRDAHWLLFWPLLLHLIYQPSRVWTGWRQVRGSSRA